MQRFNNLLEKTNAGDVNKVAVGPDLSLPIAGWKGQDFLDSEAYKAFVAKAGEGGTLGSLIKFYHDHGLGPVAEPSGPEAGPSRGRGRGRAGNREPERPAAAPGEAGQQRSTVTVQHPGGPGPGRELSGPSAGGQVVEMPSFYVAGEDGTLRPVIGMYHDNGPKPMTILPGFNTLSAMPGPSGYRQENRTTFPGGEFNLQDGIDRSKNDKFEASQGHGNMSSNSQNTRHVSYVAKPDGGFYTVSHFGPKPNSEAIVQSSQQRPASQEHSALKILTESGAVQQLFSLIKSVQPDVADKVKSIEKALAVASASASASHTHASMHRSQPGDPGAQHSRWRQDQEVEASTSVSSACHEETFSSRNEFRRKKKKNRGRKRRGELGILTMLGRYTATKARARSLSPIRVSAIQRPASVGRNTKERSLSPKHEHRRGRSPSRSRGRGKDRSHSPKHGKKSSSSQKSHNRARSRSPKHGKKNRLSTSRSYKRSKDRSPSPKCKVKKEGSSSPNRHERDKGNSAKHDKNESSCTSKGRDSSKDRSRSPKQGKKPRSSSSKSHQERSCSPKQGKKKRSSSPKGHRRGNKRSHSSNKREKDRSSSSSRHGSETRSSSLKGHGKVRERSFSPKDVKKKLSSPMGHERCKERSHKQENRSSIPEGRERGRGRSRTRKHQQKRRSSSSKGSEIVHEISYPLKHEKKERSSSPTLSNTEGISYSLVHDQGGGSSSMPRHEKEGQSPTQCDGMSKEKSHTRVDIKMEKGSTSPVDESRRERLSVCESVSSRLPSPSLEIGEGNRLHNCEIKNERLPLTSDRKNKETPLSLDQGKAIKGLLSSEHGCSENVSGSPMHGELKGRSQSISKPDETHLPDKKIETGASTSTNSETNERPPLLFSSSLQEDKKESLPSPEHAENDNKISTDKPASSSTIQNMVGVKTQIQGSNTEKLPSSTRTRNEEIPQGFRRSKARSLSPNHWREKGRLCVSFPEMEKERLLSTYTRENIEKSTLPGHGRSEEIFSSLNQGEMEETSSKPKYESGREILDSSNSSKMKERSATPSNDRYEERSPLNHDRKRDLSPFDNNASGENSKHSSTLDRHTKNSSSPDDKVIHARARSPILRDVRGQSPSPFCQRSGERSGSPVHKERSRQSPSQCHRRSEEMTCSPTHGNNSRQCPSPFHERSREGLCSPMHKERDRQSPSPCHRRNGNDRIQHPSTPGKRSRERSCSPVQGNRRIQQDSPRSKRSKERSCSPLHLNSHRSSPLSCHKSRDRSLSPLHGDKRGESRSPYHENEKHCSPVHIGSRGPSPSHSHKRSKERSCSPASRHTRVQSLSPCRIRYRELSYSPISTDSGGLSLSPIRQISQDRSCSPVHKQKQGPSPPPLHRRSKESLCSSIDQEDRKLTSMSSDERNKDRSNPSIYSDKNKLSPLVSCDKSKKQPYSPVCKGLREHSPLPCSSWKEVTHPQIQKDDGEKLPSPCHARSKEICSPTCRDSKRRPPSPCCKRNKEHSNVSLHNDSRKQPGSPYHSKTKECSCSLVGRNKRRQSLSPCCKSKQISSSPECTDKKRKSPSPCLGRSRDGSHSPMGRNGRHSHSPCSIKNDEGAFSPSFKCMSGKSRGRSKSGSHSPMYRDGRRHSCSPYHVQSNERACLPVVRDKRGESSERSKSRPRSPLCRDGRLHSHSPCHIRSNERACSPRFRDVRGKLHETSKSRLHSPLCSGGRRESRSPCRRGESPTSCFNIQKEEPYAPINKSNEGRPLSPMCRDRKWSQSPCYSRSMERSCSPVQRNCRGRSLSPWNRRSKERSWSPISRNSIGPSPSPCGKRSTDRSYSPLHRGGRKHSPSGRKDRSYSPCSRNDRNNSCSSLQQIWKRQSPSPPRERSKNRSCSPFNRNKRGPSLSPPRQRSKDRSRSPVHRNKRILSPSPTRKRSKDRSCSPVVKNRTGSSPSPCHRRNKDRSCSPVFKNRRALSPAPPRQRSKDRSCSPVHRNWRGASPSPPRKRSKDRSCSPVHRNRGAVSPSPPRKRSKDRSCSPVHRNRRGVSPLPPRKRSKDRSCSPVHRNRRESSLSPCHNRSKDRSCSPVRRNWRGLSPSPPRKRSKDRSCSPVHRNRRGSSPSPPRKDRSCSPVHRNRRGSSPSPPRKRSKDRSCSPVHRNRRGSSPSPPRKRSKDRSCSPVHRNRRAASPSPLRKRNKDRSCSPVHRNRRGVSPLPPRKRSKDRSCSPVHRNRRESSLSPCRNRSKDRSCSPIHRNRRGSSPSPRRKRSKDRSCSPVRKNWRGLSPSPPRKRSKDRSCSPVHRNRRGASPSPLRKRSKDRSCSPVRQNMRILSPSPCRKRSKDRSCSPVRRNRRGSSPSPCRNRSGGRSCSPICQNRKAQSPASSRSRSREKSISPICRGKRGLLSVNKKVNKKGGWEKLQSMIETQLKNTPSSQTAQVMGTSDANYKMLATSDPAAVASVNIMSNPPPLSGEFLHVASGNSALNPSSGYPGTQSQEAQMYSYNLSSTVPGSTGTSDYKHQEYTISTTLFDASYFNANYSDGSATTPEIGYLGLNPSGMAAGLPVGSDGNSSQKAVGGLCMDGSGYQGHSQEPLPTGTCADLEIQSDKVVEQEESVNEEGIYSIPVKTGASIRPSQLKGAKRRKSHLVICDPKHLDEKYPNVDVSSAEIDENASQSQEASLSQDTSSETEEGLDHAKSSTGSEKSFVGEHCADMLNVNLDNCQNSSHDAKNPAIDECVDQLDGLWSNVTSSLGNVSDSWGNSRASSPDSSSRDSFAHLVNFVQSIPFPVNSLKSSSNNDTEPDVSSHDAWNSSVASHAINVQDIPLPKTNPSPDTNDVLDSEKTGIFNLVKADSCQNPDANVDVCVQDIPLPENKSPSDDTGSSGADVLTIPGFPLPLDIPLPPGDPPQMGTSAEKENQRDEQGHHRDQVTSEGNDDENKNTDKTQQKLFMSFRKDKLRIKFKNIFDAVIGKEMTKTVTPIKKKIKASEVFSKEPDDSHCKPATPKFGIHRPIPLSITIKNDQTSDSLSSRTEQPSGESDIECDTLVVEPQSSGEVRQPIQSTHKSVRKAHMINDESEERRYFILTGKKNKPSLNKHKRCLSAGDASVGSVKLVGFDDKPSGRRHCRSTGDEGTTGHSIGERSQPVLNKPDCATLHVITQSDAPYPSGTSHVGASIPKHDKSASKKHKSASNKVKHKKHKHKKHKSKHSKVAPSAILMPGGKSTLLSTSSQSGCDSDQDDQQKSDHFSDSESITQGDEIDRSFNCKYEQKSKGSFEKKQGSHSDESPSGGLSLSGTSHIAASIPKHDKSVSKKHDRSVAETIRPKHFKGVSSPIVNSGGKSKDLIATGQTDCNTDQMDLPKSEHFIDSKLNTSADKVDPSHSSNYYQKSKNTLGKKQVSHSSESHENAPSLTGKSSVAASIPENGKSASVDPHSSVEVRKQSQSTHESIRKAHVHIESNERRVPELASQKNKPSLKKHRRCLSAGDANVDSMDRNKSAAVKHDKSLSEKGKLKHSEVVASPIVNPTRNLKDLHATAQTGGDVNQMNQQKSEYFCESKSNTSTDKIDPSYSYKKDQSSKCSHGKKRHSHSAELPGQDKSASKKHHKSTSGKVRPKHSRVLTTVNTGSESKVLLAAGQTKGTHSKVPTTVNTGSESKVLLAAGQTKGTHSKVPTTVNTSSESKVLLAAGQTKGTHSKVPTTVNTGSESKVLLAAGQTKGAHSKVPTTVNTGSESKVLLDAGQTKGTHSKVPTTVNTSSESKVLLDAGQTKGAHSKVPTTVNTGSKSKVLLATGQTKGDSDTRKSENIIGSESITKGDEIDPSHSSKYDQKSKRSHGKRQGSHSAGSPGDATSLDATGSVAASIPKHRKSASKKHDKSSSKKVSQKHLKVATSPIVTPRGKLNVSQAAGQNGEDTDQPKSEHASDSKLSGSSDEIPPSHLGKLPGSSEIHMPSFSTDPLEKGLQEAVAMLSATIGRVFTDQCNVPSTSESHKKDVKQVQEEPKLVHKGNNDKIPKKITSSATKRRKSTSSSHLPDKISLKPAGKEKLAIKTEKIDAHLYGGADVVKASSDGNKDSVPVAAGDDSQFVSGQEAAHCLSEVALRIQHVINSLKCGLPTDPEEATLEGGGESQERGSGRGQEEQSLVPETSSDIHDDKGSPSSGKANITVSSKHRKNVGSMTPAKPRKSADDASAGLPSKRHKSLDGASSIVPSKRRKSADVASAGGSMKQRKSVDKAPSTESSRQRKSTDEVVSSEKRKSVDDTSLVASQKSVGDDSAIKSSNQRQLGDGVSRLQDPRLKIGHYAMRGTTGGVNTLGTSPAEVQPATSQEEISPPLAGNDTNRSAAGAPSGLVEMAADLKDPLKSIGAPDPELYQLGFKIHQIVASHEGNVKPTTSKFPLDHERQILAGSCHSNDSISEKLFAEKEATTRVNDKDPIDLQYSAEFELADAGHLIPGMSGSDISPGPNDLVESCHRASDTLQMPDVIPSPWVPDAPKRRPYLLPTPHSHKSPGARDHVASDSDHINSDLDDNFIPHSGKPLSEHDDYFIPRRDGMHNDCDDYFLPHNGEMLSNYDQYFTRKKNAIPSDHDEHFMPHRDEMQNDGDDYFIRRREGLMHLPRSSDGSELRGPCRARPSPPIPADPEDQVADASFPRTFLCYDYDHKQPLGGVGTLLGPSRPRSVRGPLLPTPGSLPDEGPGALAPAAGDADRPGPHLHYDDQHDDGHDHIGHPDDFTPAGPPDWPEDDELNCYSDVDMRPDPLPGHSNPDLPFAPRCRPAAAMVWRSRFPRGNPNQGQFTQGQRFPGSTFQRPRFNQNQRFNRWPGHPPRPFNAQNQVQLPRFGRRDGEFDFGLGPPWPSVEQHHWSQTHPYRPPRPNLVARNKPYQPASSPPLTRPQGQPVRWQTNVGGQPPVVTSPNPDWGDSRTSSGPSGGQPWQPNTATRIDKRRHTEGSEDVSGPAAKRHESCPGGVLQHHTGKGTE